MARRGDANSSTWPKTLTLSLFDSCWTLRESSTIKRVIRKLRSRPSQRDSRFPIASFRRPRRIRHSSVTSLTCVDPRTAFTAALICPVAASRRRSPITTSLDFRSDALSTTSRACLSLGRRPSAAAQSSGILLKSLTVSTSSATLAMPEILGRPRRKFLEIHRSKAEEAAPHAIPKT